MIQQKLKAVMNKWKTNDQTDVRVAAKETETQNK